MIVTDLVWAYIRQNFTEQEKHRLRHAINGDIVCPPGVSIDDAKISKELLTKLTRLVGAL